MGRPGVCGQAEKVVLGNRFLFALHLLNTLCTYEPAVGKGGHGVHSSTGRSLTVSRDGSGQVFLVGGTELASNRLASIIFQI